MNREWLRNIRLSVDKSGCKVAEESGITQQMYSFIETGQRRPSVQVAKRIAAVLGFDWTQFFEDADQCGEEEPADSA